VITHNVGIYQLFIDINKTKNHFKRLKLIKFGALTYKLIVVKNKV